MRHVRFHRFGHGRKSGYEIARLTKEEYATLAWLSDRGYDAGILEAAGVAHEFPDGSVKLGLIPEHKAWEIKEYVDDDPVTFLTSNGSQSLADKLWAFVNAIV